MGTLKGNKVKREDTNKRLIERKLNKTKEMTRRDGIESKRKGMGGWRSFFLASTQQWETLMTKMDQNRERGIPPADACLCQSSAQL